MAWPFVRGCRQSLGSLATCVKDALDTEILGRRVLWGRRPPAQAGTLGAQTSPDAASNWGADGFWIVRYLAAAFPMCLKAASSGFDLLDVPEELYR